MNTMQKKLKKEYNDCDILPDLSHLSYITILDISGGSLKKIPLDNLPPNLEILLASNNSINEFKIPEGHHITKTLTHLNLQDNMITELDVKHCDNLEQLIISNNLFEKVNDILPLYIPDNLITLDIGDNYNMQSIDLPVNLKELYINGLYQWNDWESISNHENLEVLDISNIVIKSKKMPKLPQTLKCIKANNCELESFNMEEISEGIEEIYVHSNNISCLTYIPESIRILDVHNNNFFSVLSFRTEFGLDNIPRNFKKIIIYNTRMSYNNYNINQLKKKKDLEIVTIDPNTVQEFKTYNNSPNQEYTSSSYWNKYMNWNVNPKEDNIQSSEEEYTPSSYWNKYKNTSNESIKNRRGMNPTKPKKSNVLDFWGRVTV